jgi:hypothetical protein
MEDNSQGIVTRLVWNSEEDEHKIIVMTKDGEEVCWDHELFPAGKFDFDNNAPLYECPTRAPALPSDVQIEWFEITPEGEAIPIDPPRKQDGMWRDEPCVSVALSVS